jgi:hypothetical protein
VPSTRPFDIGISPSLRQATPGVSWLEEAHLETDLVYLWHKGRAINQQLAPESAISQASSQDCPKRRPRATPVLDQMTTPGLR